MCWAKSYRLDDALPKQWVRRLWTCMRCRLSCRRGQRQCTIRSNPCSALCFCMPEVSSRWSLLDSNYGDEARYRFIDRSFNWPSSELLSRGPPTCFSLCNRLVVVRVVLTQSINWPSSELLSREPPTCLSLFNWLVVVRVVLTRRKHQ